MLAESARATTAAELRFRVQAPNARARTTSVIALDRPSEAVLQRLAQNPWNDATFLKAAEAAPGRDDDSAEDWVTGLDDRPRRIGEAIAGCDQVIMLAAAGGHADAAAMIGRACSLRRITTTALVVGGAAAADRDLSRTLAQLRPWSLMVVIANSDEYILDMMTALRV